MNLDPPRERDKVVRERRRQRGRGEAIISSRDKKRSPRGGLGYN